MAVRPVGPGVRALTRRLRRLRTAPSVVVAGLLGALAMSLAMANPLSAFVASIVPSGATVAVAPVVLEETDAAGSVTCRSDSSDPSDPSDRDVRTSSSTCATIDLYGGSLTTAPSDDRGTVGASVTTVTFRNTGSAAATAFTVSFGACAQSAGAAAAGGATDYCDKLHVAITSGPTVVVADTTAAAVAGTRVDVPIPAADGVTRVPVTVTTYLDSSADNSHQGLAASQPLTWSLAA